MIPYVKGKGYSIKQVQEMIERAEKAGQKELASMLRSCLRFRLANSDSTLETRRRDC